MPGDLTDQHDGALGKPIDFREVLRGLARERASLSAVFADFCRITACCLAAQTREDEYLQAIKGYTAEEFDQLAQAMTGLIDEMDGHPFADVLGPFYTETIASADRQARGEFYTPGSVSTMMGRMTLDPEAFIAAGQVVTVCDPCCGSGGMVLACAQPLAPAHVDLLRVTLQDINPVACDMAYINTSLWGIPAEIILGNTLTVEAVKRWANIHWYRVGEPQRQQGLRMLDALRGLNEPAEASARPTVDDQDYPESGIGPQLDLF
ncbi:MAG: N-6 DNA methylase [Planctomycetota bacterium]